MIEQITDINLSVNEPVEGRFIVKRQRYRIDTENCETHLMEFFTSILKECNNKNIPAGEDDFIKLGETTYRVHRETARIGDYYIIRRTPPFRPSLTRENPEGISFPSLLPRLINHQLASSENRGGAFIIAGPLGVGKTTTAVAILGHLLESIGGVGWTLEDPPEYDLEGDYGQSGICYQHFVKDGNFANAIRRMMRCFPTGCSSILFICEIRGDKEAIEVLKAMQNGAWIIFTLHADSAQDSISRFLNLCGDSQYAPEVLANSLKMVIHQDQLPGFDAVRIKYDYLINDRTAKSIIQNFRSTPNAITKLQDQKVVQANKLREHEKTAS